MNTTTPRIRVGMVGLGMIFDETYAPVFDQLKREPLYRRDFGLVEVELAAVATRTGKKTLGLPSFAGPDNVARLLKDRPVDALCVATPDDRHFEPARLAIEAGTHVLIEKPSVLTLEHLDALQRLSDEKGVLAKVVYHKLADPDHKKLHTRVLDGDFQHVNNGYCSLLEPKSISGSQFAEWITGRNPATYVACHYLKLIDFTFGPAWQLSRITATGQRGIVGPAEGPTWDSVQLQVVYTHPDRREAAFDIHTSWVTPDNFPGYVEQEVQFRFDNAIWAAHQRKRGVELAVEGKSPGEIKYTPNHHYNATFAEPWGERTQRGYGLEVIRRFFEEVAFVEHGGPNDQRAERLNQMKALAYNDLSAERNCVAIVQSLEAILARHAAGQPGGVVKVNDGGRGLVLYLPGEPGEVLYAGAV